MQDSDHTWILQLNLGPFCLMIGHLVWEKIDLIKALKHLAAILMLVYLTHSASYSSEYCYFSLVFRGSIESH